jgi:hypothetical protein
MEQQEKELIQVLNRQINAGFPEGISLPELQENLTIFINELIQNDFQKLVAILYKVDVDENKLKTILKAEAGKDAGGIIARLIIDRETQKIHTRKQFGDKKYF